MNQQFRYEESDPSGVRAQRVLTEDFEALKARGITSVLLIGVDSEGNAVKGTCTLQTTDQVIAALVSVYMTIHRLCIEETETPQEAEGLELNLKLKAVSLYERVSGSTW